MDIRPLLNGKDRGLALSDDRNLSTLNEYVEGYIYLLMRKSQSLNVSQSCLSKKVRRIDLNSKMNDSKPVTTHRSISCINCPPIAN